MYSVEGTTIRLSRGDTGALKITATATLNEQPFTFGPDDRAVFSIKNQQGQIVIQKVSPMVNNEFIVYFLNNDTDTLTNGDYKWDVRYVIHPYYDDKGVIVNGDQVITPKEPQTMNLLEVVGEV